MRDKKGRFTKGNIPWSKTHSYSKETKKKMSLAHKGYIPWIKGKHHTEKARKKMSQALKGRTTWNKGRKMPEISGKNHPQWKGGKKKYICHQCGRVFYNHRANIKNEESICCSRECADKFKKGKPLSKEWKENVIKAKQKREGTAKWRKHMSIIGKKGSVMSRLSQSQGKQTEPEKKMEEKLKERGMNYIYQHPMYDKFLVDFFLPDQNIILEVDGRYWHSQPQQIKRDKSKNAYLATCGHKVIRVWEDEIEDFSLKSLTN